MTSGRCVFSVLREAISTLSVDTTFREYFPSSIKGDSNGLNSFGDVIGVDCLCSCDPNGLPDLDFDLVELAERCDPIGLRDLDLDVAGLAICCDRHGLRDLTLELVEPAERCDPIGLRDLDLDEAGLAISWD